MERQHNLPDNTVQQTLFPPLWGRMPAARHCPDLFPDLDAERLVHELGIDYPNNRMMNLQYIYMNCLLRQYHLACEIQSYTGQRPHAVAVAMGAGLSCLRRQMQNTENRWHNLDQKEVVALRERLILRGAREKNIACEQARPLCCAMAEHFPGASLAFESVSTRGLRYLNAEVTRTGNSTRGHFTVDDPVELLQWSPKIVSAWEKNFVTGYLKGGNNKPGLLMRLATWWTSVWHLNSVVHLDFAEA